MTALPSRRSARNRSSSRAATAATSPRNAPVGTPEWKAQVQARGRKMEAARNRAIEDADPVDRVDAELCAQRPVLNALMLLAAQIRESSEEVAQSVEGVVWEMDRERRGALCAPARQDGVELAHTIIDLLRGELLDDETRAEMVEDVRQALPPAPKRKASKARRARR